MSDRIVAGQNFNFTDPIDVTCGSFQIGEYRVPFQTAIIRAQQAKDYLNLVTDDPKYAQQDWTVEELFQREISYGRVIEIAENYLNPAKARRSPFFNSLTVVLVPNDTTDAQIFNPPLKHESYDNFSAIGPIGITYNLKDRNGNYPASGSFGVLQWNRDEVYAVAIDGQHRLASIKHLCRYNQNAARNLSISIIFLIVDPQIGFLIPEQNFFNPTTYMRSIFIDLNKHSVPVSRARNLLLDDLDPMALFVRGLISPSLEFTKSGELSEDNIPYGTNGEFYNCLPLDIVDWHSESKSKVDEGPYITSILGIDWIVNTVLNKCNNPNLKVIDIFRIDPDQENYYEKLEGSFKTWNSSWEAGIKDHFEECRAQEKTFILTREELNNLKYEFCESWGKPITRLLTTTACYLALIRKRLDKEIISPKFGQWYQLKAAYESAKAGKETEHYKMRLDSVSQTFKNAGISTKDFEDTVNFINFNIKENRILFFLVGQRALIYSLIELLNENKIVKWADVTNVGLEEFTECPYDFCAFYLVKALNKLFSVFEPGTDGFFEKSCKVTENNYEDEARPLRKEFWAGSLTRRENPEELDFSEAAAKRGAKWFTLVAHFYWFLKCNRGNNRINKQKILKAVMEIGELEGLPFGRALSRSFGLISTEAKYNDSPMKFFIGGYMDYPEEENDAILAAARERIGYLCDLFIETGLLNDAEKLEGLDIETE